MCAGSHCWSQQPSLPHEIVANYTLSFCFVQAHTTQQVQKAADLDTDTKWNQLTRKGLSKKSRHLANLGWALSEHCPVENISLDRRRLHGETESTADYKRYLQGVVGYNAVAVAVAAANAATVAVAAASAAAVAATVAEAVAEAAAAAVVAGPPPSNAHDYKFFQHFRQQQRTKHNLSLTTEEGAKEVGTGPVDPEGRPQKKARN
jgi:hypothetical protein